MDFSFEFETTGPRNFQPQASTQKFQNFNQESGVKESKIDASGLEIVGTPDTILGLTGHFNAKWLKILWLKCSWLKSMRMKSLGLKYPATEFCLDFPGPLPLPVFSDIFQPITGRLTKKLSFDWLKDTFGIIIYF